MKKEYLEKIGEICDRAHALQINVEIIINDDATGCFSFNSAAAKENWTGKAHSFPIALEAASEFLDSLDRHKRPHLTTNQAMILLDIYRGTLDQSRHMDCFHSDCRRLFRLELVDADLCITESGNALVALMLGITQAGKI